MRDIAALVADVTDRSRRKPVLLYSAQCHKCERISSLVVMLSLGRVERIGIVVAEWHALYADHFPQANGYPILFAGGRPVWGPRVFLLTPLVALFSAIGAVRDRLRR